MSDPVVMEMDDATYLNLTEPQIRETAWFKHTSATYDQLYNEDKAGILLVHKPCDKHHEHDQRWILDGGELGEDETMEMGAFQGCLFEEGAYICVCHREGSIRAVYARTRRPLAVSLRNTVS